MPGLIGIAGGTGSGKSTLVRTLRTRLGEICTVDLDSYYLDRSGMHSSQRDQLNYDEPGAIDVPLLLEHLERLVSGNAVPKPVYSFQLHARVDSEILLPAALIVVEGLFTLWWDSLRPLFDLKVFVDAPADVRLGRRIRRDVVERGRTADAVLEQYFQTVRPMHDRYVEPTRTHADVIVLNHDPSETCREAVRTIERAIATHCRWYVSVDTPVPSR
jgi:uridine kinase